MELTKDEIGRYAPYHTMQAFDNGYRDYQHGLNFSGDYKDVAAQAYDRGAECAMRRMRARDEIGRIAFKSAGATRKR